MKQIGLHPSDTGQPGGKEIGQSMFHYILPDAAFDTACKSLLSDGFTLAWGELLNQVKKRHRRDDDDDDDRNNRVKYSCPVCAVNAWGKRALSLICGVCKVNLQPAE